jgi:hypothetical protein
MARKVKNQPCGGQAGDNYQGVGIKGDPLKAGCGLRENILEPLRECAVSRKPSQERHYRH